MRAWIRDELGPEAAIAERLREDTATLLRVPDLIRRIEDRFPPRGGAPEAPPLPDVPLMWDRAPRAPSRLGALASHALALAAGAGIMVLALARHWWG